MPFFSALRQEGDGLFHALEKREDVLFYILSERTKREKSAAGSTER